MHLPPEHRSTIGYVATVVADVCRRTSQGRRALLNRSRRQPIAGAIRSFDPKGVQARAVTLANLASGADETAAELKDDPEGRGGERVEPCLS